MTDMRAKQKRGPAYDWRDHPDSGECPRCENCAHRARWAIARPEDWPNDGMSHYEPFDWRIRAFACGQHLHTALELLDWGLDVVQVYDLALIPDGGC